MATSTMERMAQVLNVHTGLLRAVGDRLDAGAGGGRPSEEVVRDGTFLMQLRDHALGLHRPGIMRNEVTTFGEEQMSLGYAVPEQHEGILSAVVGPGSLLDRFRPVVVRSPLTQVAVDVAPDWASTPIDVSLYAEGESITTSKPNFKMVNAGAVKVGALLPISEELVEDVGAPMMQYPAVTLARRLRSQAEYLMMRGTGLGQPCGVLNATSLVTVSADAGQTAGTITARNLGRMISRLAPSGFERSFWVLHSSSLVEAMNLGTLYQGPQPGAPFGFLCGRPIAVSEWASALGSVGDATLVDPAGFLVALQGPTVRSSIAWAFDQHLNSFRGTLRLSFVPLLGAAAARASGGDTLSHCVTLAARS
jgi:HK97 family phage major capsid protein